MFEWYKQAQICYAFLPNVVKPADANDLKSSLRQSRWFTRGWTLQELIAPRHVRFYDSQWQPLGDKDQLSDIISEITSIDSTVLADSSKLTDFSVAARMSWAANRKTSRREDIAYCLLGLFGIRMPLIYGEGHDAFLRLQQEIINSIDDDSILAWDAADGLPTFVDAHEKMEILGILAKHPSFFKSKAGVKRLRSSKPWITTPHGVQIDRSEWVYRRPFAWDLRLACWKEESDGRQVNFAVPLESTLRGYFGRRDEKLSTIDLKDSTLTSRHEEQPIYLLKHETLQRTAAQRPKVCKFPARIMSSVPHVGLELKEALNINCNGKQIEIPVDQKSFNVEDRVTTAFLLRYVPSLPAAGEISHELIAIDICLYSKRGHNDWYVEIKRNRQPRASPPSLSQSFSSSWKEDDKMTARSHNAVWEIKYEGNDGSQITHSVTVEFEITNDMDGILQLNAEPSVKSISRPPPRPTPPLNQQPDPEVARLGSCCYSWISKRENLCLVSGTALFLVLFPVIMVIVLKFGRDTGNSTTPASTSNSTNATAT
jgi:hypothetical protein